MCSLGAHECGNCETDAATLMQMERSGSSGKSMINGTADDTVKTSIVNEIVCKKCQQNAEISVRNGNSYCKTCFLTMTTHKFRAALGKSKTIRRGDCLLVAHSGRANSTALLHLLKTGMSDSTAKKVLIHCSMIYLDDGIVRNRTLKEREDIVRTMYQEAKEFEMTGYTACLSESGDISFTLRSMENDPFRDTTTEDRAVEKLFAGLENDTMKDELLRQLKRKLLVSAARTLGCTKVLVGDTSIDLAARVLGDISTGRGDRLSFDVGFCDSRCTDVSLLRPLGDFTADELTGYLNCYNLHPTLSTHKHPRPFPASIRGAAQDFVQRLDSEFSSTVSTIYRTSGKLSSKNSIPTDTENKCILCEIALDSGPFSQEELSAVQARTYSEFISISGNSVSEEQLNEGICQNQLQKKECCECSNKTEPLISESIKRYLCYGCQYIFPNSKTVPNVLPRFILNAIREKVQLRSMRQEITEFLL